MRKHTTIISGTFIALSVMLTACSEKKEEDVKTMSPAVVEVALPVKKVQEIWDFHTADITGEKSVDVRSRVSGYLEKINFKDGDYVKAGDILFEIDRRPFEAVVMANEARLKEGEARLTLAKSNLTRAEELIKTNAISREVLETRKADVLSSEAIVLTAKANLREALLNVEFTTVKAPISGYVSRRLVDEGNLVTAASTLLTTIVSRDVLYAYFDLHAKDFVRYEKNRFFKQIDSQKGKGPRAKLIADDGTILEGIVTYMDNSLTLGNFRLRAEFDNRKANIIPGLFGKVSILAEVPQAKIMLPELAIGTDLVGRYVLVVDDQDIVKYVPVEVAEVFNGLQIITKGLEGAERVVVNGLQRAIPGTKVSPKTVELKGN